MKQCNFTERERRVLVQLARLDFNTRDIAALFGCSSATVSYHIRNKGQAKPRTLPPVDKARMEQRRKIIKRLVVQVIEVLDKQKNIVRVVPKYPSCHTLRVALSRVHKIDVSKQTVANDLKALNAFVRVRPRVCNTGPGDAKSRLIFIRLLLRMPLSYLKRIIFTDEKIFNTNEHGRRTMWVFHPSSLLSRENRRWPVGRVLVWGAIGVGYRCIKIFPEFEKKEEGERGPPKAWRLTGSRYVRLCLSPNVDRWIRERRVVQQDGAGAHSPGEAFLQRKGVEQLSGWPPRSPQLSPIETLWAILAPRVAAHNPVNRDELISSIRTEWEAVEQSTIDSLVLSFHSRLSECLEKNGEFR